MQIPVAEQGRFICKVLSDVYFCLLYTSYIDKELYGYRVNDNSVTRRLVSSVRPDALIALNHIIDYAKEHKYVISLKDIAIARSDIRRNMMKEAILNKNKEFFINTDNACLLYTSIG